MRNRLPHVVANLD